MAQTFEIPLSPRPTKMSIQFPNGVTYGLTFQYLFKPNDCWIVDIADAEENPIIGGLPLLSGEDLLSQYGYLGFGCELYCTTDGDPLADPTWWNLGVTSHLWVYG